MDDNRYCEFDKMSRQAISDTKSLDPDMDHHHKIDSIDSDLKSYNNSLKKLIRQAKIKYCTEQCSKNKSNIRHTWSIIKEILNKCKTKEISLHPLR